MTSIVNRIFTGKKNCRSGLSWYHEKGAFKRIIWILRRLRFSLVEKFYRFRGTNYGLLEAIFFPTTIRHFLAYTAVIQTFVEEKGIISVLEVGGGGPGISSFLDTTSFRICIADVEVNNIKGYVERRADAVGVDGSKLPFRNNTYDVVVSIDTLEHVPKRLHKDFIRELKRVARKKVVITGPVTDNKGRYKAREYIDEYELKRRKLHEHSEVPALNNLQEEFPDSEFEGYQNCYIRNIYTGIESSIFRVFAGLFYLVFLKKWDNQPPYFSCRITYDKTNV